MLSIKKLIITPKLLVVIGLCSISVGLSLSKPLIGLGQALLGVAWLMEGQYKLRIKQFFLNKLSWVLISYFVLSLVGLIYTNNLSYGLTDVKRKLPLLIIPFLLYDVKLNINQLKIILGFFIVGILASSLWSIFVKLGGLGITITDERDLSRFDSHIRFGLSICIAIFILLYFIKKEVELKLKIFVGTLLAWLVAFLFLINLYTGIVIFGITSIILSLIYGFRTKSIALKLICLLIPTIIIVFTYNIINSNIQKFYKTNIELPQQKFSPYGEIYWHDMTNSDKENGNYVYRNIAQKEVEYAWNKVSSIKYNDNDVKGQPIFSTLFRFLTSKGEYKNQKSVMSLTPKEINAIERGVSNIKNMNASFFELRIQSIIWEINNFKDGRDYNGHSIVMRWIYWKTAFGIIKTNPWFGVGTGDVQQSFDEAYQKSNSILQKKYRLRSHNQFITAVVTFGVMGGISILVFLFYPFLKLRLSQHLLYLPFFIIIVLSMLTEDTLDTQVGITLFVFFNTLFIYFQEEL